MTIARVTTVFVAYRYHIYVLSVNIFHVFPLLNSVRSLGSPYCTAEEDYCQANAECHEKALAFTCQCKAGFILDGALCVGNDKISLFSSLMKIY